jgi:hypothetical protein
MTLTSYVSKRSKGYFGQKQRHVQPQLRLHEICTSAGFVLTQTEITRTEFKPFYLNVHIQMKLERGKL